MLIDAVVGGRFEPRASARAGSPPRPRGCRRSSLSLSLDDDDDDDDDEGVREREKGLLGHGEEDGVRFQASEVSGLRGARHLDARSGRVSLSSQLSLWSAAPHKVGPRLWGASFASRDRPPPRKKAVVSLLSALKHTRFVGKAGGAAQRRRPRRARSEAGVSLGQQEREGTNTG